MIRRWWTCCSWRSWGRLGVKGLAGWFQQPKNWWVGLDHLGDGVSQRFFLNFRPENDDQGNK